MSENINLKVLHKQVKQKPLLKDIAKEARISQGQLSNIVAGRRTATPETKRRIVRAFRRAMR